MESLLDRFDFSELFDDVLNKAKIVLSEKLEARLKDVGREELDKLINRYSEGVYKIVLKSATGSQYTFYMYNKFLIGVILENREKKYGVEAYSVFERGIEQLFVVEIYSVPEKVLEEIIGSDRLEELKKVASRKVEVSTALKQLKAPAPASVQASKTKAGSVSHVKEALIRPAPKINLERIRKEIYELIERLGFDILDVKLELREDVVYLIIELAPMYQTAMMLLDLESTLYAALSVYIEKTKMYDKIIKSEIKMADVIKTKLLLKKEDFTATTILGRIVRTLNENGIPVTKSMYRISGSDLEIYLEVKKPVYPGVNTKDVLQKLYDRLKDEWEGNMKIHVKAGRFSKFEIP